MVKPGDSTERQRAEPATVRVPAGAPTWITPELIAQTLRVWQRYYEKPLTPEDALEIITSAGRLMDALADDGWSKPRHSSGSEPGD